MWWTIVFAVLVGSVLTLALWLVYLWFTRPGIVLEWMSRFVNHTYMHMLARFVVYIMYMVTGIYTSFIMCCITIFSEIAFDGD